MSSSVDVISYEDLLGHLRTISKRRFLLLGNGFSIACDDIFSYASLFDAAVERGLSKRAQLVFGRLGTNNFEGALRLLDNGYWLASTYGLDPELLEPIAQDVAVIKDTLVHAVANSHLSHTGLVSDKRKDSAKDFLSPYQGVFTTNYDLLLYWVSMHGDDSMRFMDGFASDSDDHDAPYVTFQHRIGGNRGLYFLHGALHFYLGQGELRKHTWIRTGKPLTESIREGLDREDYPLFVAEGSPEQKLAQIQRSGYLWYCLDKFKRIESPLVVFGHALGKSDQHLVEAVGSNTKLGTLAVGLHGDPSSFDNQEIVAAVQRMYEMREVIRIDKPRAKELSPIFFSSESAQPWGADE